MIIICLPFDSSDQKTLPGYTLDLSSCFEPISSFFPSIDSSSPSQFLYFDTLTCALDPTTKIYIQQISNEILAATRVIALRGIHQSLQCKISSTLFSGHIMISKGIMIFTRFIHSLYWFFCLHRKDFLVNFVAHKTQKVCKSTKTDFVSKYCTNCIFDSTEVGWNGIMERKYKVCHLFE